MSSKIHILFYQVQGEEGLMWHWRRIENGAAMHMSGPFATREKAEASAETDINGYKAYPEARFNGPLNRPIEEIEAEAQAQKEAEEAEAARVAEEAKAKEQAKLATEEAERARIEAEQRAIKDAEEEAAKQKAPVTDEIVGNQGADTLNGPESGGKVDPTGAQV